MSGFGCAHCIPDPPKTRSELPLKTVAALIDEPHFIVSIRRCTQCQQHFVSVFCERIDWAEGKDPQVSTLMPLTPEEAQTAMKAGETVDLRALEQLAYARRFLRDAWLGDGRSTEYLCGMLIGPHD